MKIIYSEEETNQLIAAGAASVLKIDQSKLKVKIDRYSREYATVTLVEEAETDQSVSSDDELPL